jgi:hypothetical protein
MQDVHWADVKIFIGNPQSELADDEIWLDVPDDYKGLPRKTYAMLAWADKNHYRHVYKMDTDTFIAGDRLERSGFESLDYTGWSWGPNDGYLLGGPGYWLSSKAIHAILSVSVEEFAALHEAEDVAVGKVLIRAGIIPIVDQRYCDSIKTAQPLPSNNLISTHRCSKVQLLMAHAAYTGRIPSALMDYQRDKHGNLPDEILFALARNESVTIVNRLCMAKLLQERKSKYCSSSAIEELLKKFYL